MAITAIKASTDSLCRDGADEISRDPRRERLKPRQPLTHDFTNSCHHHHIILPLLQ